MPATTTPGHRVTVLHARGVLDVDTGDVIDSGYVRIEGTHITEVATDASGASDADEVIDLPELTLIPGLMDMEVDLVLGGPGAGLADPVTVDPVEMTLRAAANAAAQPDIPPPTTITSKIWSRPTPCGPALRDDMGRLLRRVSLQSGDFNLITRERSINIC